MRKKKSAGMKAERSIRRIAFSKMTYYYVSNSESKVEMHPYEMIAESSSDQLEELVKCLSTNPEKLEYKAPLAMGFQILPMNLEEGTLQLDMDAAYKNLPVTTEVLVRAAIVRTLTQLSEVNLVMMTVEGNQLYDNNGSTIGWMNAEQFIDNDGNEINTYELARVKLYFAGEDGTNLIAATREKRYSTSMLRERFVVEELIAGPSGQICAFLDRLFYASRGRMAGKAAAAVVSCRRGGASAAFDRLNKYFSISNMVIATSQYWNQVHGNRPEEVLQDAEGLQTMRTLGQNMAWLIKCIEAGKKQGIALPAYEPKQATNFIR